MVSCGRGVKAHSRISNPPGLQPESKRGHRENKLMNNMDIGDMHGMVDVDFGEVKDQLGSQRNMRHTPPFKDELMGTW
ncbi:hypothetical protein V6N13_043912 [Hibiscus sabdariffa]